MKTYYNSRFGNETHRGSIGQLIALYEARAYAAERDGDLVLSQRYFQHAEHWKRVSDGQTK